MQAMLERFEMRLDEELLGRLDAWRSSQSDLPSRAEAARRLLVSALDAAAGAGKSISLSAGEKLTLMLFRDLFKHLKVKGEMDPEFIAEAIGGGHLWGLEWRYQGLFHGHVDERRAVSEVVDILDMWSFLEHGYSKLSKKEKDWLEKEAAPFGRSVKFEGFSGNDETEWMSIAKFLIEHLDRFTDFADRSLNCHFPSLDAHRRMLGVFRPIRQNLTGRHISAAEIAEIMKARTHPSRRSGAQ